MHESSNVSITGGEYTCKCDELGGFLFAEDGSFVKIAAGLFQGNVAGSKGGAVRDSDCQYMDEKLHSVRQLSSGISKTFSDAVDYACVVLNAGRVRSFNYQPDTLYVPITFYVCRCSVPFSIQCLARELAGMISGSTENLPRIQF